MQIKREEHPDEQNNIKPPVILKPHPDKEGWYRKTKTNLKKKEDSEKLYAEENENDGAVDLRPAENHENPQHIILGKGYVED